MPSSKPRSISKLLSVNQKFIRGLDSDSTNRVFNETLDATAASMSVYTSTDSLPVSAAEGTQALVSNTNRFYIFTGGGWYNVAIINNFNPQWITQPNSTYDLGINGAVTSITVLASDSDDVPITYIATPDSDFLTFATVTHDSEKDNTWLIQPIDSENGAATGGTGTVTFKASDGVNLVQQVSTFSLTFETVVENSKYTSFLLQADASGTDDQVDASTNNTSTVGENNSIISSAWGPYHPGKYSAYFDDVSINLSNTTYVRIPDTSSVLTFGTGDFTIETWIWVDNTNNSSSSFVIYDWVESNTNSDVFMILNGNIIWKTAGTTRITSSFAGEYNKWTHVAVVRNSSTTTLYVDGTSVGSWADSTNYSVAS